jgi:hypothetical protein
MQALDLRSGLKLGDGWRERSFSQLKPLSMAPPPQFFFARTLAAKVDRMGADGIYSESKAATPSPMPRE